jgi:protein gp37
MNKTGIEYLTDTWNPLVMRCTPVSEGCANCWHLQRAEMLSKNPQIGVAYRAAFSGAGTPLIRHGDYLEEPLRRREPARIGVQFMGDLFHEEVESDYQHAVWDIIEKAHWHTFLVLTKRPENMLHFVNWYHRNRHHSAEPFSNLWLGVTAENQRTADERIPILLQIRAAVRFVSIEPMLGPVDLDMISLDELYINSLTGHFSDDPEGWNSGKSLNWVIVGGESGSKVRPMHPEWPINIREQCIEAGVPFFFKQWGEFCPRPVPARLEDSKIPPIPYRPDSEDTFPWGWVERVGKKKAGRLLDGREWNEYPERAE